MLALPVYSREPLLTNIDLTLQVHLCDIYRPEHTEVN